MGRLKALKIRNDELYRGMEVDAASGNPLPETRHHFDVQQDKQHNNTCSEVRHNRTSLMELMEQNGVRPMPCSWKARPRDITSIVSVWRAPSLGGRPL